MKRKHRFAAAYVITLSVAGCKAKDDDRPNINPPEPTRDAQQVATADAETATAPTDAPAQAKRKRVVTRVPTEREPAGRIDWKTAKPLNPEVDRRPVYARRDGSCFVEIPTSDAKAPGDGTRAETVDCPPEMDDPAWDTCFAGTLVALPDDRCACSFHYNPPPPPTVADCPKHRP